MINRKARIFRASFSIFVRLYDKCMTKQNENRAADICNAVSVRSEADSNRCIRFCRPLPSHSAIRPIYSIPRAGTTQTQPFHCLGNSMRDGMRDFVSSPGGNLSGSPPFCSCRPESSLPRGSPTAGSHGARGKFGTSGVQIYKHFPILQNLSETLRDFLAPHPLFGKI